MHMRSPRTPVAFYGTGLFCYRGPMTLQAPLSTRRVYTGRLW